VPSKLRLSILSRPALLITLLSLTGGIAFGLLIASAEGHGPRRFPLQCFDCHFPHPLIEEPECFNCHGTGEAPELDCFDCHGRHNPEKAPDLSGQQNCFRCHEVS